MSVLEPAAGGDEAKMAAALKKEIGEKVKAEPVAASRLVQSWIHEPKSK